MWNPVVRKNLLRRYMLNHNSTQFFSGQKKDLHIFSYIYKKFALCGTLLWGKFFSEDIYLTHNSTFFLSGEQRGFLKLISKMLSSFYVSWFFSFLVCAGEVCIGYCTGQIFNLTKRGDYEWLLMWYCFQYLVFLFCPF